MTEIPKPVGEQVRYLVSDQVHDHIRSRVCGHVIGQISNQTVWGLALEYVEERVCGHVWDHIEEQIND